MTAIVAFFPEGVNCELKRVSKQKESFVANGFFCEETKQSFPGRIKTEQERCSSLAPTTTAESNGGGSYKRKLNFGMIKAKESQNSKRTENVASVRRDSAGASSSSAAEFTIIIKRSYLILMRIPRYVRENLMPEERTIFKIRHPNMKKSWHVVYVVSEAEASFSGGWRRLALEYPLAARDICRFTFLKPEELILSVSKP
ncbi:PREDICTED: B3 domain-containing protein At2g35310-like [Camelina sativa]|uniref:B3 domain-containing protein At2g35310-like n=1 Tax=Camelina sativa TaxID=90675 RepID=A0ABM0ZB33_CAMSA|nr:PREDICTED: B3 domain-containing protein At2g35310-like [Camelina sativa]